MSGDCESLELIVERPSPRADHLQLPLMPIEGLQQGQQIPLRPTNGPNPMHI